MINTLSNAHLEVKLFSRGAELQSLVDKRSGIQYIWQADSNIWGKHSPVLFPIVGTLKENRYRYNGEWYVLPRHGFARDMEFTVSNSTHDSITYSLYADEGTKTNYPFEFVFSIQYTISDDLLITNYIVQNPGESDLLFSVGGHPAFNVPLEADTVYEDYELHFNKLESLVRWPITKDGLIAAKPEFFREETDTIQLTKALFATDALVFKSLSSDRLILRSKKTNHGLEFHFQDFPFLGLWAAKEAPFVCIEPWCGIADSEQTDQQLEHKEGIVRLEPRAVFSREWKVQIF